MRIATVPVTKLNPAAYNPRRELKPGDPEYEALQRSLRRYGCVEPLVWNERTGTLVGGHQRLRVLIDEGATEVQVSVVDLSSDDEKALNLALNKIQGGWDQDKLARVLDELIAVPAIDLRATGFEYAEARDIIGEMLEQRPADDGCSDDNRDGLFDIGAELAREAPIITQPGDLIELGREPMFRHRLLCGDATDAGQVARLMAGERAVLFATDPPYLVGYDGSNHNTAKKPKGASTTRSRSSKPAPRRPRSTAPRPVTWDDPRANPDLYPRFIAAALAEAVAPNAAWYCWHASSQSPMLHAAWTEAGILPHCQIIWAKNRGVPSRTWYTYQHEPCLMGWRQGTPPPRHGEQRLGTVWQIETPRANADRPDHPTPKPLKVFEIPMRQHTLRGEACYEPFAGSGTQIIAAERLRRRCLAMEISPRYCDLIVRRFIAFAGEGAVSPEIAEKYRPAETRRTAS